MRMMRSSTVNLNIDKLFTDLEINKVKDKFKKDSQEALEEAIKKHRNI
jgi:hypothetical protein